MSLSNDEMFENTQNSLKRQFGLIPSICTYPRITSMVTYCPCKFTQNQENIIKKLVEENGYNFYIHDEIEKELEYKNSVFVVADKM